MVENDQKSTKRRGMGMLAVVALLGALLVPFTVAVTASTSAADPASCDFNNHGSAQGKDRVCCPNDQNGQVPDGVAQGEIDDVCCADELTTPTNGKSGREVAPGVTQGGGSESPPSRDIGVKCCPNGEFGHWEWGGYGGQNLSYCDAPPYEPPATAPPATDPPAVSPATSAPKKAAAPAAKPTFTG